jgi:hypothetical protein
VIAYRKVQPLRLSRAAAPQPPFWAATIIAPYAARRSSPIAVDYLASRVSLVEKAEVTVTENVRDEIERATIRTPLAEPALIEATELAEVVFGRGEEALAACAAQQCAALHLISTRGALPASLPEGSLLAVSAWPLELERLERLLGDAAERAMPFGVVVPVIFPVTTDLVALDQLTELAGKQGARFLAALPVDLDATARKALAESVAVDEEGYDTLFHADLDAIGIATERHIAALAESIGADDFVTPPRWEQRSNWNGAVLLTLTALRMMAMRHEVETATMLVRSARAVAALEKPIERIAAAASLAIVEALDDISVDILTDWLETGRAAYSEHVAKQWRLRRDAGV